MRKADAIRMTDVAIDRALIDADYAIGAINLPGKTSVWGRRSDGFEATARLSVLAASRLAGLDGQPPPSWLGGVIALIEAGAAHWPTSAESAQAIVENANVAKSLLIADSLWDGLNVRTQDHVIDRCTRDLARPASNNNWALYAATSAAFLEAHGHSSTATARAIEYANASADEWYLGDGWYADGAGSPPDYYSAWTFHYELVLIAWKSGDAERLKVLIGRLRLMCDSLLGLIGDTGAPVYWGRSLTYRFALAAPLAWLAVIDPATPNAETLGSTWSAVVHHFGEQNPLALGWTSADRRVAQRYSGPGASYWAYRAFIALLLPPTHPFWADSARGREPHQRALDPGLIVRSSGAIALLHNHSSSAPTGRRDNPLHARRSYSSHTSPAAVAGLPGQHPLDS